MVFKALFKYDSDYKFISVKSEQIEEWDGNFLEYKKKGRWT
jgi:hypothetical protein